MIPNITAINIFVIIILYIIFDKSEPKSYPNHKFASIDAIDAISEPIRRTTIIIPSTFILIL